MLSACALSGIPPSPSAVANQTTLDEQSVITVEQTYRAARTAVELGVDVGLIKGKFAGQMRTANRKAYQAVLLTRKAYEAGNQSGYRAALADAKTLTSELLLFMNGESP